MSHSFAKTLPAVQLQIGFPTAVDGRIDKIVENLAVVRPAFMAGPPRIFEKVHAKVVQTVEEEGGARYRLLLISEGYALTETSAGACIVLPHDPAFGVAGRPLVGTEVRKYAALLNSMYTPNRASGPSRDA